MHPANVALFLILNMLTYTLQARVRARVRVRVRVRVWACAPQAMVPIGCTEALVGVLGHVDHR